MPFTVTLGVIADKTKDKQYLCGKNCKIFIKGIK